MKARSVSGDDKPAPRRRQSVPRFSRATARAIRQAVALATELDLYSVAIAGAVWTIRTDRLRCLKAPP